MKTFLLALIAVCVVAPCSAQQAPPASNEQTKARVFVTLSDSWETRGSSGGAGGVFGGHSSGGARPQTAEIIKTFGERCPGVTVNNIQEKADYVVVLDHEGGKGVFSHKNKVVVFARESGDSVMSKSTLSLGGSVQAACEAIVADWPARASVVHARATPRSPAQAQSKPDPPPQTAAAGVPAAPATGKLSVASVPDGAEIEVDGTFVGNTPSDVQLSEGDHAIAVKKTGFKPWERKMKVTSGSSVRLNANLDKADTP